jgi:RNA polymerase sigma factor (sigma-70 family)
MYDKILKLAQKLFGDDHPITVWLSKLSKKEFKNLSAGFKGNDDLDMLLFCLFKIMKQDDHPMCGDAQNAFWAYFYSRGTERVGFMRRFANSGPTEDTMDVLSGVLLKLINSVEEFEFRTSPEFDGLISQKMKWRALDLIRKKDNQTVRLPEFFEGTYSASEGGGTKSGGDLQLMEQALSILSSEKRNLFAQLWAGVPFLKIATEEDVTEAAIRQRKSRLIKELSRIMKDTARLAVGAAFDQKILIVHTKGQRDNAHEFVDKNFDGPLVFCVEIESDEDYDRVIQGGFLERISVLVLAQGAVPIIYAPLQPKNCHLICLYDGLLGDDNPHQRPFRTT